VRTNFVVSELEVNRKGRKVLRKGRRGGSSLRSFANSLASFALKFTLELVRSWRESMPAKSDKLKFVGHFVLAASWVASGAALTFAQNPAPNTEALKKANARPVAESMPVPRSDPFDGASIEKMTGQCVTLDTEAGVIEIEMLPATALESARSFLNLAATGALNTTVFSRVVKGFVIQGGNLSTGEKWSAEMAARMSRHLPDEPSDVKHVRGIVSMARGDEPNSATTHFFILVGDGPHLDGKFTAFGRVIKGIEVADSINHAPAENEKPVVPVRIKTASVAQCQK
jgi:peptidyl-prolyl cis-trans isomerase B (cyclophilin B)